MAYVRYGSVGKVTHAGRDIASVLNGTSTTLFSRDGAIGAAGGTPSMLRVRPDIFFTQAAGSACWFGDRFQFRSNIWPGYEASDFFLPSLCVARKAWAVLCL